MGADFRQIADYFKTRNGRVVNMSWSDDVAEFEDWISKTGGGADPVERKKRTAALECYLAFGHRNSDQELAQISIPRGRRRWEQRQQHGILRECTSLPASSKCDLRRCRQPGRRRNFIHQPSPTGLPIFADATATPSLWTLTALRLKVIFQVGPSLSFPEPPSLLPMSPISRPSSLPSILHLPPPR